MPASRAEAQAGRAGVQTCHSEDSNAGRGAAGVEAAAGAKPRPLGTAQALRAVDQPEGPFHRVYYGMVYEAARGSTLLLFRQLGQGAGL